MLARELEGLVSYSLRKVHLHGLDALHMPIEANNEAQARIIYLTKLKILKMGCQIDLKCLQDIGFSERDTELLLSELDTYLNAITPDKYLH